MRLFRLLLFAFARLLVTCGTMPLVAQEEQSLLAAYRAAAMNSGDAVRGRLVFESQEAGCTKCHAIGGKQRLAGPDLAVIGDTIPCLNK